MIVSKSTELSEKQTSPEVTETLVTLESKDEEIVFPSQSFLENIYLNTIYKLNYLIFSTLK